MWRISDSKCYTIAKRPTFQVWGGSLYSGGTITTSAATKKTLRYLPTYTGVMVFGSWVEQSVTSFGKAIALASGAAGGNGDYLATGLGGSHEEPGSDYCKYRVPLSLANYNAGALSLLCPSAQASGSSGISAKLLTRESLTGRLPNEDSLSNNYEGDTTIEFNNDTPKNIVRYNVGGNTTINAATINTGKTHIINSNGNVYINGNILYQSATYTELKDIPKVIIYGKNVIIGCTVTQIDAIVAAEEILDTCETPTDPDINREQNSHQLTVNGAIITNVLKLNRTYGAAWGIHSSKPGEIVNYDTSTILWGRAKADPDNKHHNLTSVYVHELAPRYQDTQPCGRRGTRVGSLLRCSGTKKSRISRDFFLVRWLVEADALFLAEMLANLQCNEGYESGNQGDNKNKQPNWADNNGLFHGGIFAVEIDGLADFNCADGW